MVWHPAKYAELLASKMKQHNVNVWLVNTGWSGGSYGKGSRIKLKYTRAIIDAIHDGVLSSAGTQPDPIFGFDVIKECPKIPSNWISGFHSLVQPSLVKAEIASRTALMLYR